MGYPGKMYPIVKKEKWDYEKDNYYNGIICY